MPDRVKEGPQAPGAIPNGTRVVKVMNEPGDGHELGDQARVLASFATPPEMRQKFPDCLFCYFLDWDDMPGLPVFTRGDKIAPRDPPK